MEKGVLEERRPLVTSCEDFPCTKGFFMHISFINSPVLPERRAPCASKFALHLKAFWGTILPVK